PIVSLLIDLLESGVLGGLTTHARTGDDGRRLAQLRCPFDTGILHRFPRGDYRELREAVHEVRPAVVEVRRVGIILHFRAVLKAEAGTIGGKNRPDARTARVQRLGEFVQRSAERTDGPDARDDYAPHLLPGLRAGVLGLDQPRHSIHHVAYALHVAYLVIGNIDIELVLQGEEDFYGIHGVNVERLKLAVDRNGLFGDPFTGGDGLQNAPCQFFGHMSRVTVSKIYP